MYAKPQHSPAVDGASIRALPAGPPSVQIRWLRDLAHSGLCRRMPDGSFQLAVSQADLARTTGMSGSSGTLSRRLTSLDRTGLISYRRPLTFRLPEEEPNRQPAQKLRSEICAPSAQRPSIPENVLGDLVALCSVAVSTRSDDVVLEAFAILGRALELSGTCSYPTSPTEHADLQEHVQHRVQDGANYLTDFSTNCSPTAAQSAVNRASSPVSSHDPATTDRYSDILDALAPLTQACARAGLPGVTNPVGLVRCLAGVSCQDVRQGALLVAAQLAQGKIFQSPVGVVVGLARKGYLQGLHEQISSQSPPLTDAPDSCDHGDMSGHYALLDARDAAGAEGTWLQRIREYMHAASVPHPPPDEGRSAAVPDSSSRAHAAQDPPPPERFDESQHA